MLCEANNDGRPRRLFHVTLPWSWNGDPSDEEGSYNCYVQAADERHAKNLAAQEMVDSASKTLGEPGDPDYEAEVSRYIQTRVDGWCDVSDVTSSIAADLCVLFERELFADGVRRDIDMDALRGLIVANRDAVVLQGAKVVTA
jgi:hypothetical protein